MEKKPSNMTNVTVLLKTDHEEIELRDRTSYSPEELNQLYDIFGKAWINDHPIMYSDAKLTLDLSAYDLDFEDLQYFAFVYNNPLTLQDTLQKECTSLLQVSRFQKVSRALNLSAADPTLNNIRDQFFEKKKILVLLDLNGSLMVKSEKDLGGSRPPDMKWKRNHIYLRPGNNIFLRKILEHPRSVVAICSSMIAPNIVPIRSLLLRDPGVKKAEGKFLKKIFDRAYTVKDPNGKDEHATLRDLTKVWKDTELKGKFGPSNTLLIESDEEKAKNFKANLFRPFPYTEEFALSGIPNNTYYMSVVADYIVELLNKADDVPDYLMKTAFEFDQTLFMQEDTEFKKVLEEQKLRLAKETAKKAEEQKTKTPEPIVQPMKIEETKKTAEEQQKAEKMKDIAKKMEDIDI